MQKVWMIKRKPPSEIQSIRLSTGLSNIASAILYNNGLRKLEDIKKFIKPNLAELHNPLLFKGMKPAVERIVAALEQKELICCYGDYDVDGITGSLLLYNFLRSINANVIPYIPDRIEEGYGLNKGAVTKLAAQGVKILITADCGIRSTEEVSHANQLGVDVIITDHHEVGETLPQAYAIINPKQTDCTYPFKGISGSGVTMKLAWAITDALKFKKKNTKAFNDSLLDTLAFATLGTVADMVPLLDENRAIVHFGLDALKKTTNVGIQSLLNIANLQTKEITSEDIAFQIAPRINAAGRLGKSNLVMQLFTTTSPQEAQIIATEIDQLNKHRQEIEREYTQEALEQAEKLAKKYSHSLVLDSQKWHSGIIGIIASKILEKYYRPIFVVTFCEETAKEGKGSARSIEGCNLTESLAYAHEELLQYGGHQMAAGFQIKQGNLQNFRDKIEEYAKKHLAKEKLTPVIKIDSEVDMKELNLNLLHELHQLEPFGSANPTPILASRKVNVIGSPRIIGKKNNHIKFRVAQHGIVNNVIAFNFADRMEELLKYKAIDIAYYPFLQEWNGQTTINLQLKDFREARDV